jgi:hypothetical protein
LALRPFARGAVSPFPLHPGRRCSREPVRDVRRGVSYQTRHTWTRDRPDKLRARGNNGDFFASELFLFQKAALHCEILIRAAAHEREMP